MSAARKPKRPAKAQKTSATVELIRKRIDAQQARVGHLSALLECVRDSVGGSQPVNLDMAVAGLVVLADEIFLALDPNEITGEAP